MLLDGAVGPPKAVKFCNLIVLKSEEEMGEYGDCASPSSLEFENTISLLPLAAEAEDGIDSLRSLPTHKTQTDQNQAKPNQNKPKRTKQNKANQNEPKCTKTD